MHYDIILPSTSRSSKWSSQDSNQNPVCSLALSHTCHMPHQSKPCMQSCSFPHMPHAPPISTSFISITLIIFHAQYNSGSTSLRDFLQSPVTSYTLTPKCFPQHPVLEYPHPMFFTKCDRPSFTPIQNKRQIYSHAHSNLHTL